MIVEERLTTYIEFIELADSCRLKRSRKRSISGWRTDHSALHAVIAWLFASDKETGCCT